MTIKNLSKSLKSCLNDADFSFDIKSYCKKLGVEKKSFSDLDLVIDAGGIIAHIEGKTKSVLWFKDLHKKSFKELQKLYKDGVSKGQVILHKSYSERGIISFCTIGQNVEKPGYSIKQVETSDSTAESFIVTTPANGKDAHPCYHNSLFMHCLLPNYDLKEVFINWFQKSLVCGDLDKERLILRHEENWTPERPGGRSLYICAIGYKTFEEDAHIIPFGGKDNRETMNNIPNKFIHYLASLGYKASDFYAKS